MAKDKDASNKEELYKVWQSKIQTAKDHHEKFKGKELREYREAYEGKQWTSEQKAKYNNEVVDNMVYMVVSTLGPAIGMSRPEIYVTPMKSSVTINGKPTDPSLSAARLKTLLDFMWKKLDLEVEFRKTIDDSLIGHDGAFYTGYDMETFETFDEEGDSIDLIESENIVCRRIDPDFILKDLMSTDPDLKDARWIAIKWQRNLSEVKEDNLLKNTSSLQPNGTVKFDKITQRFSFAIADRTGGQPQTEPSDKWAESVEGYDIWDKKNRKFYSLVTTHDKFLREEDRWPLEYTGNGFPIDLLWYNYNPMNGYALSDTGLYLTKQYALNFLESLQIDHADIQSNVKLILNKKNLTGGQDVEKWASGPAWSYLYAKGDATTAAAVLTGGPGASDLFSTIQALKRDILQQVGVDQFMVGSPEKLETAGEVSAITQRSTAKHAFRARAVERFEGKVLTKLAKVVQQVSSETEIPLDDGQFQTMANVSPDLLVNGEQSQEMEDGSTMQEKLPFMRVDNELLAGEFVFDIKPGSTKHKNEATEQQDAMLLSQAVQSNPLLNKVEVTKIIMEKLGFGHLLDRIMRDPKEVAQENQQAQEMQFKMQMAEPQLKTSTDLQKTEAKNQTALQVAQMKSGSDGQGLMIKADSDQRNRDTSLLETVLKIAGDKDKARVAASNGGGKK